MRRGERGVRIDGLGKFPRAWEVIRVLGPGMRGDEGRADGGAAKGRIRDARL